MKNPSVVKVVNNRLFLAIILGASVLASGCATRDENGNIVESDRECRGQETLGSKMRRSVCMSKAEWALVDERAAERAALAEERTDDFLRSAVQQGTFDQGPGFDTP